MIVGIYPLSELEEKKKTKEKLKKLGDPKIWSKEEGHVLGPFIGPPF